MKFVHSRSVSLLVSPFTLLLLVCGIASAQTKIGIHFTGGKPDANGAALSLTEVAGVPEVAQRNWNEAPGKTGKMRVMMDNGSLSSATIAYNAAETWVSDIDPKMGPNYKLMYGYLDSSDGVDAATLPTVSVANIPFAKYDVYVYISGSYTKDRRVAAYMIGDSVISAINQTDFDGKFVRANDTAGNYIVFSNLTTANFTLTAIPVIANDQYRRAAINGIQIVKHGG